MKSLVSAAIYVNAGSPASRRPLVRLLGLAPAVLLLAGLFSVWAGPLATPVAAATGDWTQFHNGPTHSGYNATETTLSASNVAALGVAWTGTTGSEINSSPAVADGVVYVGSSDHKLYAYAVGCASGGGSCTPLWTATTGGALLSSPAVANGVVYVGSGDGYVYAFAVGCASGGGTCTPLWKGAVGSAIHSSPAVADGVVYVGSWDHKVHAFDAAGVTGCSGSPKICTPLWTATTGDVVTSTPAVANGVVYVGSYDHKLYAYAVGCNSGGGTCTPLWTATTGDLVVSSPAVANGVVYVGSQDDKLYAFDAAGISGCSGSPKTCTPVWTATTGAYITSSPAVANGVVYVGSADGKLYAYAVGCASGGGSCTPLWTATTGDAIYSSPAIANGVVYVGSFDHKLYAYAVGCASGGGACTPLWSATTGSWISQSSPAVANGVVYIGSDDNTLYAFSLPRPATYHALTPARILDSRDHTGGLGIFSSHVAQTFGVTGHGGVAADAIAVTGNLTVTQQTSAGFLFAGPIAMNNPTSSTLNFPMGDDRANAVTVALSGTGTLSITYAAPTLGPTAQVIFDVTGYFTPDTTGATYHALTPARILDSRDGTGGLSGAFSSHVARTFTVIGHGGVPAGAIAVTGNLTVTQQSSGGFLSIGPDAQNNPTSSTLNFPLGDDRANAVTVALSGSGTLSITYAAPTLGPTAHVIFDVTGYFTLDMTGATYHALTPSRILDSRDGTGGLSGAFSSHVARTFQVTGHGGVPSNAIAVTGNLTVTQQSSLGFLFVGPNAQNNPTSSTLNFPQGDDRANAVTVALAGSGTLSITYAAPTLGPTAHVIFDVTGYFTP